VKTIAPTRLLDVAEPCLGPHHFSYWDFEGAADAAEEAEKRQSEGIALSSSSFSPRPQPFAVDVTGSRIDGPLARASPDGAHPKVPHFGDIAAIAKKSAQHTRINAWRKRTLFSCSTLALTKKTLSLVMATGAVEAITERESDGRKKLTSSSHMEEDDVKNETKNQKYSRQSARVVRPLLVGRELAGQVRASFFPGASGYDPRVAVPEIEAAHERDDDRRRCRVRGRGVRSRSGHRRPETR